MSHTYSRLPHHVAIIMDGNGRWAQAKFMPRVEGHRRGLSSLERVVECAAETGVKVLTVFAFSSENWARPQEEVSFLMSLFRRGLLHWKNSLASNGIRLRVIGDASAFSDDLKDAIRETEAATAQGTRMDLYVAANYGGQWDITQAVNKLVAEHKPITPDSIAEHLSTGPVDLMIRTGGEQRISNFLLWQASYAELFFSPTLWPDYSDEDFHEALRWFSQRERRFGKTREQLLTQTSQA